MGIKYVDEPPVAEMDGDLVRVKIRSGGEQQLFCLSRHNFRMAVEAMRLMLNDADERRCDVVEFRRAGH